MIEFFFEYLDWILGIYALGVQLCVLKKWWWGPIAGLSGQGLWIAYALNREDYGLLPSVAGFTCLYIFGIWKWTRERER